MRSAAGSGAGACQQGVHADHGGAGGAEQGWDCGVPRHNTLSSPHTRLHHQTFQLKNNSFELYHFATARKAYSILMCDIFPFFSHQH